MKSQTKALLASVMVLALALSSVGGVTYSWFSDTNETDIDISTGSVDIRTELQKTGITGSVEGQTINSPTLAPGNLTAPLNNSLTESYSLKITNNNIPVIASVYIILERFSAYSGNTYAGEVFATYDGSGNITGYKTYDEFFNGDPDRQNNIGAYLKFGINPSSQTLKASWNGETVRMGSVDVKKYDPETDTTDGTYGNYNIRYFEYRCYLGDVAVDNQNSDYLFDFNVQFNKGYKSYIMQKMYVRTIATQIEGGCQSYTFDSENKSSATVNGYSVNVNDVPPILFLGTNFRIAIDSISIFQSGIKTVDVSYIWNNTTLDVTISFKDSEGNIKEPVSGNIRIQSYNPDNPCSLIIPSHSCTISLNVGGSSS